MNYTESLTLKLFAELLGIDSKDLPESCIDFIEKKDFRFNIANNAERENLILKALKKIDSGELSTSGKHKKYVWQKGWKENLDEFHESGNLSDLIPNFVRNNQPVRLGGKDYIYPRSENF